MNRREVLLALIALSGLPIDSLGQQPSKLWRIGVLETTSIDLNSVNLDAFRKGLQDLGYFEGRNFVIEYRSADGRSERFPELVADLLNRRVDVIVFRGTPAAYAARKATQTIPLISVALGDPLLLVKSLARPGVNLTGLSSFTTDLDAKRVELLTQTIPSFKRIAVLGNMANLASVRNWNETEKAAIPIGVQPVLLDVRKREDIAPALDKAVKERIDAVVVALDTVTQANRRLIVELVAERRLPTMYHAKEFVEVGGLMVYGPSYPDLYRRAATYVDKILKGANPAEIPIEQPIKLELVVNLKTAKALGITIPQSILLRADQMIE